MINRRLFLFVASLALAGALSYWHLSSLPMHSALPAGGNGQAAIPLSPQQTESVALVAPSLSPQASSENTGDFKELLQRFNQSQSYRAFIFDALKHPELGGLQIAQTVLNYCRRYPLGTAAPATMSTERAAAMSALVTRCDMSKEENAQLTTKFFLDSGNRIIDTSRHLAFSHPKGDIDSQAIEAQFSSPDPLKNMLSTMMKTCISSDARAEAISRVLHTRSPFLILLAIPSESMQSAGVNTYKTYFDGTWYRSAGDTNTLYLAYDLASCNLGLDCSASSYKALSLCATRGFCGDNVTGAIRNGVAQREGLRWEQIEGLASSLTTAIQQGNAHAFIPPEPAKKP